MRFHKILVRLSGPPRRPTQQSTPPLVPQWPREMRHPVPRPPQPAAVEQTITGRCWVVDGDTIVIGKVSIRLGGIDAPELDHPFGQQAKWALVKLCKGQTITARLKPEMSYDRVVATCFLPDGRDLAAEMVRAGLALDWPKFSGGKYRHLEAQDARKRLWRAHLRQSGALWPEDVIQTALLIRPAPIPAHHPSPPRPYLPTRPDPEPITEGTRQRPADRPWRWLIVPGLLIGLAGCALIANQSNPNHSETTVQPATGTARASAQSPVPTPTPTRGLTTLRFAVTVAALNIRAGPSVAAPAVGQLQRGAEIVPVRQAGAWIGFVLTDGTIGWVHGDYLERVAD